MDCARPPIVFVPCTCVIYILGAFNFALAFFVPPAFKNIQWKTYIVRGFRFSLTIRFLEFFALQCLSKFSSCFRKHVKNRLKKLVSGESYSILILDILFDENIPPWKTSSGLRMAEKAAANRRDAAAGKRNSDTTLQHDENIGNMNGLKQARPFENIEHEEQLDRSNEGVEDKYQTMGRTV